MQLLDVSFSPPTCQKIENSGTSLSYKGPLRTDAEILALEALQTQISSKMVEVATSSANVASLKFKLESAAFDISSGAIKLIC